MADREENRHKRRGHKDNENRDYRCKCGKSYLSYAATFTHVKNKHDSNKQFLQSIIKPARQKIKRGRPIKQTKLNYNNRQIQSLSVIQEAILNLSNIFKKSKDEQDKKLILQGNEQNDNQDIKKQYDKIQLAKSLSLNIFQGEQSQNLSHILQFEIGLNKHFTARIAARVRWHINYIVSKHITLIKREEQENILDRLSFKENSEFKTQLEQINSVIDEALKNWIAINNKKQQ